MRPGRVLLGLFLLTACARAASLTAVHLPEGAPGIGFDDLRYSSSLHRLLVPSGRSGRLNLVDPDTLAVTSISGFSSRAGYPGGHDDGPTSVDEGLGKLYVTDRTSLALLVVDVAKRAVSGRVALGAEPDYVRFVAATREVWVSEPAAHRIQIFALDASGLPTQSASIEIANGPESLEIDVSRGRAYTHRWQKTTLAIDLRSRAIVAEWPNGCAESRGLALDEARGWLFSSCSEGKATLVDLAGGGRMLSTLTQGAGFDVIGYSSALGHLYLAGGGCQCLLVAGANAQGQLKILEQLPAPAGTHCAVADDRGHAFICDPRGGGLLRLADRHEKTL